jgi:hypothetical protein
MRITLCRPLSVRCQSQALCVADLMSQTLAKHYNDSPTPYTHAVLDSQLRIVIKDLTVHLDPQFP